MVEFLLEIATEEIPASYIEPALDALGRAIEELLQDARLGSPLVTKYGTPRRLVVHISGLEPKQDSREVDIDGPPAKVAFDAHGNPTQAAKGFARKCGVPVEKFSVVEKDGGKYVTARKAVEGRACREILAEALPVIIAKLPFPKSMKWNDSGFRFARPIRGIVALLGNEVLPFEVAGV
ncbi:MAG: glycine--tRNA ligase subunit beta, partial [Planctomycetota bacterium]